MLWDWYETGFETAYGHRPHMREIVRRCVGGDADAVEAFRNVYVFGDADAGAFARFSGNGNLIWAAQEEDGRYGTV